MLADAFLPPGAPRPETAPAGRDGISYRAARWTPEALAGLAAALAGPGSAALAGVPDEALLAAWAETVEAFLDPRSAERQALDPALARLCGLSPQGLDAGLEAVLGGVRREPARRVLERAGERRAGRPGGPGADLPALVVLASNLPALAVQPLLPLLALRRPTLLKSPSAEPLFAPAFLAALARRLPELAPGLAAVTWRGGDEPLEGAVLPGMGAILAYGEEPALASLSRRAPGRVLGYGPKTSLAVLSADADPAAAAEGLARDAALFDQRGCLSIAAVYVAGDAEALAVRLAGALSRAAGRWPPGPAGPAALAAVQQMRLEADLRGLFRPDLPPLAGTVLVEPDPAFRPSPGLRTVRIHPLPGLGRLPGLLAPWAGRLQGAALAGGEAWRLAGPLARLGFSRFAAPGELQSPDASWHNGGIDPLAALLP